MIAATSADRADPPYPFCLRTFRGFGVERIAFGREVFEKLPLNAALKDVPLMAAIIKDPAFVIPPALLDGAIPLYLSVLAFLEPVTELIQRCA